MGPLENIRVVEFDAIGPVPLCAMLLADMGADVVRIARPRGSGAFDDLGETILHRGRSHVELDLKHPAEKKKALEIIEHADVLLEGFRPGVMERLGLGPGECLSRAPRLVYGRMTGWGQYGDLAARAGHDINYIAIAGALSMMGEKDRLPIPPLNLVGDYAGGSMFLAMGVLAALMETQRSGKGQVLDVAMTDGVPLLMSLFLALRQTGNWVDERQSNMLDGGMPYYRCYACADGKSVAVGALEPQFYRQLLEGLTLAPEDHPQHDKGQWLKTQHAFEERFRSKKRDKWMAIFAGTDACVSPVLTVPEAINHAHNQSRNCFVEVDGFVHPAPAPRFSRTPGAIRPQELASVPEVLARWMSVSR